MATQINRICPYCGHKLVTDFYRYHYRGHNRMEVIAFCENDKCPVQPCTDATIPSRVYKETLAITGDKK